MDPDGMTSFERRRQRFDEGHTIAWEQTLEEVDLIAKERREDGWEATVVMAAHTDTVSKDMNNHDRFGLMHVIPNNYVNKFVQQYDDSFTEYLAYGTSNNGVMYVVIDLIDPNAERSILVPCSYDMTMAHGMTESAAEEGALYSYFKKIDGEILGEFRHEEFEPLVTPPSHESA